MLTYPHCCATGRVQQNEKRRAPSVPQIAQSKRSYPHGCGGYHNLELTENVLAVLMIPPNGQFYELGKRRRFLQLQCLNVFCDLL